MPNTFYPEVKYKRLSKDMPLLKYAHKGDAGIDLCATADVRLSPGETVKIGSGIAAAIPNGFVGLVFARSGLGTKGLVIKNGTGVIDAGYRGEIALTLFNNNECGTDEIVIHKYDRVAQLVIAPVAQAQLIDVGDLSSTERGANGFGSSGVGERL